MKKKIVKAMSNMSRMIGSKGCLKKSKDCLGIETRQSHNLSNRGRKSANNASTSNL